MEHFEIGDEAPDIELPRDGGGVVRLSDHRGDIVIVFFYPKDNTEACTVEARDFTALKHEFDKIGAVLIGISPDSVRKHDNFKRKHDLDVVLGSDVEKQVLEGYGVWAEKTMYGRKYMGVVRSTMLIDRQGRIARFWRSVRVPGHAAEVLEAAKALG